MGTGVRTPPDTRVYTGRQNTAASAIAAGIAAATATLSLVPPASSGAVSDRIMRPFPDLPPLRPARCAARRTPAVADVPSRASARGRAWGTGRRPWCAV